MARSTTKRAIRIGALLVAVSAIGLVAVNELGRDPVEEGLAAFQNGNYSRAAQQLERAVKRGRGTGSIYRKLARSYELLRRFPSAGQAYRNAMKADPDDPSLIRAYGEMLIRAGEDDDPPGKEAEAFARKCIRDPENRNRPEGHYLLGKTLYTRYRIRKQKLREETLRTFKGPFVWRVVGTIDYHLNSADYFGTSRSQMIENLEDTVNISPSDPIYARIDGLRRTQEEALETLRKARAIPGHEGRPTLVEASFLRELGRREAAERLARSLLDRRNQGIHDEVRIEAQRLLAMILESDPDASDEQLREAANYWGAFIYGTDRLPYPPREKARLTFSAHNSRGSLFVRLKSPQDLDEVSESLLAGDPNNPFGLFYRGMGAYFRGDYDRAEIDLNASLNKRRDFITLMTLGRILAKRGRGEDLELALSYIRAAAKDRPHSIEPILAEARLHLNRPVPNYLDAYAMIRAALAKKVKLSMRTRRELLTLRDSVEVGLLKKNSKESYATPDEAKTALELDDRAKYALYYLATHYEKEGRFNVALRYADRLLRVHQKEMLPKLLLARLLVKAGGEANLEYADRLVERAHDLDPEDPRPSVLGAKVAKAMNLGGKYWRQLSRAVQLDPQDWETRFKMAELLVRFGNEQGARFHLDVILAELGNPPYEVRRLDLQIKLMLGDQEGAAAAIAEVEKMSGVPPADIRWFKGWHAELQGKVPMAIHHYKRGIELAPDRGDLIARAARLEMQLGDVDAALARLVDFRKRGGKHLEVNALLGRIYLDRWKLKAALSVFAEMRPMDWADRRAQLGFGLCGVYLNTRHGEAIWALTQLLSARPRNKAEFGRARRALTAIVFLDLRLKKWSDAVGHLAVLDAQFPGSPLRRHAILAYFNGDVQAARRFVSKGLRAHPRAPFLRFLRGLLNLKTSRTRGVLEDVSAILPGDVKPEAPWDEYALAVARARPGFGRMILAAVAEVHLLTDRLEAAAQALRVAVRAYPNDPRLEYLRAHVLHRIGQKDVALAMFHALETKFGLDTLRDRAILLALDKRAEAIPLLMRYASKRPREGERLLTWARFEAGPDHFPEVLKTLRRKPRWHWDLPDQVLLTGLRFIVDGPEGALAQLPGPESVGGAYLRDLVVNARQGEEAVRFVQLWSALIRSMALFKLPLFRSHAAYSFESVLSHDSEHPLFLGLLARLQTLAHDYDAAAETLNRIRPETNPALRLLELGRLKAKRGNLDDAARTLERAVELKPRSVEARIALATALLDAGRPGEAAQVVVVGYDCGIDAGEPALQAVLGRALEAVGDPSGAVTAYGRALNRDPYNMRIAYRMAKRLLAGRSYVLAAHHIYLRYPTLRFEYPDLKLDLGLALYRFGFLEHAKANLEGFPYSGDAAVYLGHIARQRGDKEEAIRQYRYAFNLDPIQHAGALLHIVEIHRKEFKLREALKVINEYLKLKPQDAKAQATRARILQDLFRKPKALKQWIKVLQLDPRNADAFIQCSRLYREEGKEDDARRMIEVLKRLNLSLTPKQERELEKECLMLGVERPKKRK